MIKEMKIKAIGFLLRKLTEYYNFLIFAGVEQLYEEFECAYEKDLLKEVKEKQLEQRSHRPPEIVKLINDAILSPSKNMEEISEEERMHTISTSLNMPIKLEPTVVSFTIPELVLEESEQQGDN